MKVEKHSSFNCPTIETYRDGPVLPPEQYELLDCVDEQLAKCDTVRVRLLAMVARAVHAFQQRSYDTCLILLWTVIENLINKRYDALVAEQQVVARDTPPAPTTNPPSSNKKKSKKDKKPHKDISTQISTLNQHRRLPAGRKLGPLRATTDSGTPKGRFSHYLENVRQARNDFVHNANPCHDEHCDQAYAALQELVCEDWKITLPFMYARTVLHIGPCRPGDEGLYTQPSLQPFSRCG